MLASIFGVVFLFSLHYDGTGSFPSPLSKKEEKNCFEKMHNEDLSKEERRKARHKLIEHNLRLVKHIVKKHYSSKSDQEDLCSTGEVGLIKAVDSYDYLLGTTFSTYASTCIKNEILMSFRSGNKDINNVQLDEAIEIDSDGSPLRLIDIICSDIDIEEIVGKRLNVQELYKWLNRGNFKAREMDVLKMRYGLYGQKPHTQQETADILGISRPYVSRIEKTGIDILRKLYNQGE